MLRGVNVGGHHLVKMEALRALYGSLGLEDAQSYVQSGNVLFKTKAKDAVALARRVGDAIESAFGFRSAVIIRTSSDLRDVIARNPFGTRDGLEPRRLLVFFLESEPGAAARQKVSDIKTAPEELHISGRELYIHFPNGMGGSKLPLAAIERALGTPCTARNWNSVTKMLEMAERMEASAKPVAAQKTVKKTS